MSTITAVIITIVSLFLSCLVCSVLFGGDCPVIISLTLWVVFAVLIANYLDEKKRR